MSKRLLPFLVFLFLMAVRPSTVMAQYGQTPKVLGAETPKEHKPVETALEINPLITVGAAALASSASFYFLSRRVYKNSIAISK